MKLGVWLPAVAAHPRFPTPDWERTAGAGELAMIALAADELGDDCVCAPEHVALPAGRAEGTRYWDPLTTLGYLAARTRRIQLAPLVIVLGYRVTTLLPRILSQSAGHYTDQLAALAALVSGEDP